jgi:DNA-binding response OmpR family regulator
MTYQWRFLLIEDREDIAVQVQEAASYFVDAPDTVVIERRSSFKDGLQLLSDMRFDILILDLKDDQNTSLAEHDVSAGLEIFKRLKEIRFSPVVFYTAHAHQVKTLESPFVRVVEKTEGLDKLIKEIKYLMSTGLPKLSQIIETAQREYMWGFASERWADLTSAEHKTDIAHLMARRLASTLELQAIAFANQEDSSQTMSETTVHPMRMYVHPPLEQLQAGDILDGDINSIDGTWIVLTPTCDLFNKKAEKILLARCLPLTQTPEYQIWAASTQESNPIKALEALIGDNRIKALPERYKYLPGTVFLNDSVIDFQDVVTVTLADTHKLKRVACLDSPFAEALLARFTRYFGRLGTPNLNKAVVMSRLKNSLQTFEPIV